MVRRTMQALHALAALPIPVRAIHCMRCV